MNEHFFQYKTRRGDFLVIKRQQLKPNNHDWITIDHTIVPIKFLNHLKFCLKGNFFYRFSGYSQTNGNRRAGFTCLSVKIAVEVGL